MRLNSGAKQPNRPAGVPHAQVMQASFGRPLSSLYGQQLPLSVAQPADACQALANPGEAAGTVVLVLRGTCFFAVKVPSLPPHKVALFVHDAPVAPGCHWCGATTTGNNPPAAA